MWWRAVQREVLTRVKKWAYPRPAAAKVHVFDRDFIPTIDIGLVDQVYGSWRYRGFPDVTEEFIHSALTINRTWESHLNWYHHTIQWVRDRQVVIMDNDHVG